MAHLDYFRRHYSATTSQNRCVEVRFNVLKIDSPTQRSLFTKQADTLIRIKMGLFLASFFPGTRSQSI